jgi:hypothetical protein
MRSRVLILCLLAAAASACSERCLRNSDCAAGQGCVQSACVALVDMAMPDLSLTVDLRPPPDLAADLPPHDGGTD